MPMESVGPRSPGRGARMVWWTAGAALLVGSIAFLAGLQLGSTRTAAPTVTVAMPTAGSPSSTSVASPTELPDRSRFLTAFDPNMLARKAGLGPCVGNGNGSYGDGRGYSIASGRCTIPAARQHALTLALEGEISTAIRETAKVRGGDFAGGSERAGSTIMSWNYSSNGFDGTVYLVATSAGDELSVVIILTEQLATGITAAGAEAAAKDHVPPDAVYVSAVAGRFADVYVSPPSQAGADIGVAPNDTVWVVTFTEQVTICPPDGSPCWSPRSGTIDVVLDYATGAFQFSASNALAP